MEISKVFCISFFLLFSVSPIPAVQAEKAPTGAEPAAAGQPNSKSAVYIVILKSTNMAATESLHIETLSSILGSQESAKKALIYNYNHATCGFSARLTPEQAADLKKLPGVLSVLPSRNLSLHKRRFNFNNIGKD